MEKWLLEMLLNWYWGFTKKGWTTDEYGAKWFTDIFLPETYSEGKTSLLYMDVYSSCITGKVQYAAL